MAINYLASTKKYKVLLVKTLVKGYRKVLFDNLKQALEKEGIEFRVLYGQSDKGQKKRTDNIELPVSIGKQIPSKYLFKEKILFQWPGWKNLIENDLIIVVNGNRNLINIPLLILSKMGLKKVALWGHGCNYQGNPKSVRERVKRKLSVMPYWWFAYTNDVAKYVSELGFDAKKITAIDNAIDTSSFREEVTEVCESEIEELKSKLGIHSNDKIALYCGALYQEKRVPFLLEAAEQIQNKIGNFKLLILGAGLEADLVDNFAAKNEFVKYLGPVFGREKAIYYKMAEIVLNPGLVGLGILDSFAAGTPFLSMADSLHSPEIAYLEHNVNGLMIHGGVDDFVQSALSVLNNQTLQDRLAAGALNSSERYTIENMVENVKSGIMNCLEIPENVNVA